MYELKTVDGKVIKINSAFIQISENNLIESGYFVEIRFDGILPRCRKTQILSQSVGGGNIIISNLYGYAKQHQVDVEEWRTFIKSLPVKKFFMNKFTLAEEELKKFAVDQMEKWCDCEAITKWNEQIKWYDK